MGFERLVAISATIPLDTLVAAFVSIILATLIVIFYLLYNISVHNEAVRKTLLREKKYYLKGPIQRLLMYGYNEGVFEEQRKTMDIERMAREKLEEERGRIVDPTGDKPEGHDYRKVKFPWI